MKKNKGFTLAEALLTMTVMGVVAALLIPTVVSDVRENANKAKAMALKVDLSGALSKMVMLENRINKNPDGQNEAEQNDDITGEFVVYHLAKYMKFSKICSSGVSNIANNSEDIEISNNYADCGWIQNSAYRDYELVNTFNVYGLAQTDENLDTTWAARTQNGISLLISYNPFCADSPGAYINAGDDDLRQPMCLNIIYDVNGRTSPNIIGNDVGFATVFFGRNPEVALPVLTGNFDVSKSYNYSDAEKFCGENSTSGNEGIPSAEEFLSLHINSKILPDSMNIKNKALVFANSPTKWTKNYLKHFGVDNPNINQSGGVICTYK